MTTEPLHTSFLAQINENNRLIIKICRIYTNNDSDREDLLQEIILTAWKGYPGFRGDSKFSTWLYRIAINTSLNFGRNLKRSPRIDRHISNLIELPDHSNDVYDKEEYEMLNKAIRQLNEIEKSIIILYLDNKTYEEMEGILGIANGTLRTKMSRIKDKLRTFIK